MVNSRLVSVIMPCHNGERYIRQAIQSVINQTYPFWELLVINDASTDGTDIIVRSFCQKDERVKYYCTEKPSGSPTLPRNIGIEKAEGRFIAFLDCDDLWLPTRLEHQLPLIFESNVAIAFSNYRKMDVSGVLHKSVIKSPNSVTYKQLLRSNCIGCLTALYDTEKVGKVFFKYVGHEDYVMWLSILKKGYDAYNTNTEEAYYRVTEGSVSSNKKKVLGWQWNILRNIEGLSALTSALYFSIYAYKAFLKFLK